MRGPLLGDDIRCCHTLQAGTQCALALAQGQHTSSLAAIIPWVRQSLIYVVNTAHVAMSRDVVTPYKAGPNAP